MDESELLIARAALASPAEAVLAWNQWKASNDIVEASTLLSWAGGYMYRNLLAAGVDDPYLGGIHKYNWIVNNRKVIGARKMILELSSRFTITPLKSFGMSEDNYSRGLRPLADFDFYVAQEHVEAVAELLNSRGFAPLRDLSDQELFHRIVPQRGSWNFLNSGTVDVDLHWRLLDHLDSDVSERLVTENSTITPSEFGPIRRLSPELMLICLAGHHAMSPSGPLNFIFDFYHLLASADVAEVSHLAAEAGIARETNELCATIAELVGAGARPDLAELEQTTRAAAHAQPAPHEITQVAPRGEKLPSRYFEKYFLMTPRFYRFWFARGRPLWLERLLFRLFGGVARVEQVPLGEDQFPARGGILATGWHFRNPTDTMRWAVIPDARVVFADAPAGAVVHLELDPEMGPVCTTAAFEVFANGNLVGTCTRGITSYRFPVPSGLRRVEVSLRVKGTDRFLTPGMQADWYRMLAPVSLIELEP